MGARADQIENHIRETRHELGDNLRELEVRVKAAADWRNYFRRNPLAILGAAFVIGVALAGFGRPRN